MPTIAAIATPAGNGGIAIVRVSGPGAKNLLSRVFLPRSQRFVNFRPWTMHRGVLLDADDEPLDDVLAVFMPGPATYSGEDMAEVHCHGGAMIASCALDSFLRLGARLAEPGEFSKRAYLNGRMDLAQAEAVAELVSAPSREAARHGLGRLEGRLSALANDLRDEVDELRSLATVAIDFPDDEIEGFSEDEFAARVRAILESLDRLLAGAARARLMSEGAQIVLAGAVNAGKSSLFNALAGHERALVTEIPGTTRDFIDARLDLEGLPATLIDTAGIRAESRDQVEMLGIAKSRQLVAEADLLVLVADGAAPCDDGYLRGILRERGDGKALIAWNKTDLARTEPPEWLARYPVCHVSAVSGQNVDALAAAMRGLLLDEPGQREAEIAPNMRQARALEAARNELALLLEEGDAPFDCRLARLDTAAAALETVISLSGADELLNQIFSRFCIGK